MDFFSRENGLLCTHYLVMRTICHLHRSLGTRSRLPVSRSSVAVNNPYAWFRSEMSEGSLPFSGF